MIVALVGLLILALAGVIKGADYFLEAAEKIGCHLRLPAFVIGVVLVGFGTSLPELATSLSSIASGYQTVTLANIIGSNMANILLIVGLSTLLIGSLTYKKRLINMDLPYLLGATALFGLLIADGQLSLSDSLFLLVGFIIYIIYTLVADKPQQRQQGLIGLFKLWLTKAGATTGRQATAKKPKQTSAPQVANRLSARQLLYQVVVAVLAVGLLGLASRIAVMSMLEIAAIINIGVSVITFLTLALGTSLPELLISFKTLRKGQGDLFLGNIIGSSVFNILLIGGIAGLFAVQILEPAVLSWSLIGLLGSATVFVVAGITQRIDIWQGAIFVLLYLALILKIIA